MENKKIVAIAVIATILVATVAVFVFLFVKKVEAPVIQSDVKKPIVVPVAKTQRDGTNAGDFPVSAGQNTDTSGTVPDQVPNARLGAVNMQKITSIPKSPMVHFNQTADADLENDYLRDGIDVGSWTWSVSQDSAHHFAYVAVKRTGEVKLILDGKAVGDVYSDIGDLQFSPDGNTLVYHGYDVAEGKTYLVIYNGKSTEKIYVYKGYDLHPQYDGGSVSEGFSADGKHFVYEKSIGGTVEIFLDGKKIQESKNIGFSEGYSGNASVSFDRSQNESDILYKIAGISENTDGTNSYEYHVNDRLITSEEYDKNIVKGEVTSDDMKWHYDYPNDLYFSDTPVFDSVTGYSIDGEIVGLVNGFGDNGAYVVNSNRGMPLPVLNVALNGSDARETFDEIVNLRFSPDNKHVQFVGRKGRDIYDVSYPIVAR
ncbi:MAG: hypothetical protein WCL23_03010 [Candidatus Moraniibacteriota bacterium]